MDIFAQQIKTSSSGTTINMIWSGTQYIYKTVIEKLKTMHKIGSENLEAFINLGLKIKQNAHFSIDVEINPIMLTNDRTKHIFTSNR